MLVSEPRQVNACTLSVTRALGVSDVIINHGGLINLRGVLLAT